MNNKNLACMFQADLVNLRKERKLRFTCKNIMPNVTHIMSAGNVSFFCNTKSLLMHKEV